jgi:PAS domain S-box-containing protein
MRQFSWRRTTRRSVLLAAMMLFVCCVPQITSAATSPAGTQVVAQDPKSGHEPQVLKKHILVITSQPYLTDWFNTLNNSLRSKLYSSLSADSKLSYEYIGSESLTDADYNMKLLDMLHKKYARIKLDMVIAVMPVSSQFVLDHGESIFPGIATVFVLPSKKQIAVISGRPQSGLVKSAVNAIPDTIEHIRVLLPETEHLLVVSGSGADDLTYQKTAEDALKNKGWPKTVDYLKGLPAEDLAVLLKKLPKNSAVLMLTYLQDQQGAPLTTVQVMKAVSSRTAVPIFSFYDTVLGLGIVGGKLTSAEAYGEAAAETALKMFQAARPLPLVETVAEARDIYDWRQIEKWKISRDRLPAGSDIRYRKITFWEEHMGKIILVAGIIVLQAFLILALLFNLARRKRAEEALSASEKKYRDIFDNAIMGIYQSTPAGKYLNVNPALAKLFGYSTPEEMLADVDDIQREVYVNPEERIKIKELFATQESVKGFQVEYQRKDHSRFWISITGAAVRDQSGGILYYEGTVEDITLQKQAENELIKYRDHLEELVRERTSELEIAKIKAESSDHLKSAFLATMSHELRTPLNSIIGFTGILLQRLGGPLNEEQDKQLHMVYNSARHLLDLINDVLDISKIEADQLNVVCEDFNLRDSVEKVIKSSQPLANKKGIELSAIIAPEIGRIKSDRRRVEQILLNLISNAVKFTEQGFVRLDCKALENKIVLSVQDSGIGIKQDDMGLLFNAFRQIESGITRKYDGTGLGLSISRKLSHLLGGEIEVESIWGKGSTFRLILPHKGGGV